MAAIDKLWIKDYSELDSLRRWALIYYPKLFIWLNTEYTNTTFNQAKKEKAIAIKKSIEETWKKVSSDGTVNSAIAYYLASGCLTEDEASKTANTLYSEYLATKESVYENTELSIMNTPLNVDRKLKWICPVPCVRLYLQSQCGVKERWYYKLFWKGKKHFEY